MTRMTVKKSCKLFRMNENNEPVVYGFAKEGKMFEVADVDLVVGNTIYRKVTIPAMNVPDKIFLELENLE